MILITYEIRHSRADFKLLPTLLLSLTMSLSIKIVLLQIMQRYYDDLQEINELSNERAVTRAFWVFKNKYDRLSDHWYWAFASWETARAYYNEAKEDAKRSFFDSRSGRVSDYLFDDYLHGLLDVSVILLLFVTDS